MTRIFVISAIAFSVASSAWAGKIGCWEPVDGIDKACPNSEGYQAACRTQGRPNVVDTRPNIPTTCGQGGWYFCTSNFVVCEQTYGKNSAVLNSQTRLAGNFLSGRAGEALNAALNSDGEGNEGAAGNALAGDAGNSAGVAGNGAGAGAAGNGNAQQIARPPLTRPERSSEAALMRAPGVLDAFNEAEAAYRRYEDDGSDANRAEALRTQRAYEDKLTAARVGHEEYAERASAHDQEQAAAEKNNPRPTGRDSEDASECGLSAKIDASMGCAGTRKMMKTAEITNQIGQIGGTVATQIGGAQAQNSALSAGTQSAALQGAAAVQGNTGKTQMLLGAVNAMMGWMQMRAGGKHEKNARKLDEDFQSGASRPAGQAAAAQAGSGDLFTTTEGQYSQFTNHGGKLAENALNNNKINSVYNLREYHRKAVTTATNARNHAKTEMDTCLQGGNRTACSTQITRYNTKEQELADSIQLANREVSQAGRTAAETAKTEQRKIAEEAKNGGLFAMLQGAQQIGQGVLNIKAAGQLSEAARKIADAENDSGLVLTPPGQDVFPSTDPRTPTVITGNGANPNGEQNTASQDQTPTDDGTSPLGGGIAPPPDNAPIGMAPTPGKFNPGGGAGGGGGGGGGGGLNGGSTQAPGPDQGEKGPTAANPYVAGTTPVSGGGGMVGPPPQGAKDQGLNPADMLAQALGLNKPQERDPTSQAYGGRVPASRGGMGMGLGLPEEDIFKMVEGGYRRQIKAGNIGG